MFGMIKNIGQGSREKRALLAFLEELDANLETFYVMDQRQFITQTFSLKAWEQVKDVALVHKHESVGSCIRAMEEFNALYKEYKSYEQWYASDLNNKTPDNARKLHGMKHELDKKLKAMESLIIPAGQALEKDMIAQGYIKI